MNRGFASLLLVPALAFASPAPEGVTVWSELPLADNPVVVAAGDAVLRVHADPGDNRIDFVVSAPDRPEPSLRFALRPAGWLTEGTFRLDRRTAGAEGTVQTTLGNLRLHIRPGPDGRGHRIALASTEKLGDQREIGWTWEWFGPPGAAARVVPDGSGGHLAFDWRETAAPDGRSSRLVVAGARDASDASAAAAAARRAAAEAARTER
jgi:hypothetical protein